MTPRHPVTSDGRYFEGKGRPWRLADLRLAPDEKTDLVCTLVRARWAVKTGGNSDAAPKVTALHDVDVAKQALGERGTVCWTDGDLDRNRQLVKNTSCAAWSPR